MNKIFENAFKALDGFADMHLGMVLMGNGKTGRSLENKNGCVFMKWTGRTADGGGVVRSPKCPNCYAAAILNKHRAGPRRPEGQW